MDAELVLEGVAAAGALGADERAAAALLRAGGGEALVALLRLRQADDEHVLQTVFAFRQILSHPRAADYLVTRTGTYCNWTVLVKRRECLSGTRNENRCLSKDHFLF